MGRDEPAVDIDAVKDSYRSHGFMCFHLCHAVMRFGFTRVAVSLRTQAQDFSVARERIGVTSKWRQCSCRTCQRVCWPAAKKRGALDGPPRGTTAGSSDGDCAGWYRADQMLDCEEIAFAALPFGDAAES
jgi:hypothetical protein